MASAPAHRSPAQSAAFALGAACLLGLYLAESYGYVLDGRINHDEGWYLHAALRVMDGDLPYRDFAYFQAPLLPFVYGPAQKLFGPSLEVGRLTSFAASAATVALGARLAFVGGGRLGALVFLALVCLTPQQLWAFATTRTEPLSALLWMVTAFSLLGRPRSVSASGWASAAGVLAAGTRVSSVPAALGVLAWVAWRHRRARRELAVALAPGALAALALAGVALAGSADAAFFNVFTAQAERDAASWGAGRYLAERLRGLHRLRSAYGALPGVALACAIAAAAGLLASLRRGTRPRGVREAAALGALGLAVYLPNLYPRLVHSVYFASAFPLFAVLLAWCAGATRRLPKRGRPVAAAAVAALILLQAATFASTRPRHASTGESDLAELRRVADYVASVVPPGGALVTMDAYVAVESGRRIAPGWEMSLFSYFPQLPDEVALRYHVLSSRGVRRALRSGRADAVVLSDRALGVLVERRLSGFRPRRVLTEAMLQDALPDLAGYRLARVFPRFGQFRDPLYVLLPAGS